jgi:hypothetical protein
MSRLPAYARASAWFAAVPLLLVACTGQGSTPSSAATSVSAGAMPLEVSGLQNGATVTGNDVAVSVEARGWTISCAEAGKPNKPGVGHYHIELDHALVNMYCTPSASVSMQNVSAGPHTLTVLPAKNDHEEVKGSAVAVTFSYQPSNPLPVIPAASSSGKPSIHITAPAPGTTVSGTFTVKVDISNFTVSGALFGKANVSGYGHWHLNVDTTTQGMMGMATMLGMSAGDSFEASTEGLSPGKHTFFAILVDNQHAPLEPAVVDKIDLVVG